MRDYSYLATCSDLSEIGLSTVLKAIFDHLRSWYSIFTRSMLCDWLKDAIHLITSYGSTITDNVSSYVFNGCNCNAGCLLFFTPASDSVLNQQARPVTISLTLERQYGQGVAHAAESLHVREFLGILHSHFQRHLRGVCTRKPLEVLSNVDCLLVCNYSTYIVNVRLLIRKL